MGMKVFKTFIIGCGRIAGYSYDGKINNYSHGYAYKENPKIELVGCMDIDSDKSQLFSERFNCSAFNNFKEGVKDTESEIISICTPDDSHFEIVNSLLHLNSKIKVIFLEKPACATLDEMEYISSVSEGKNIQIVINHTRRFDSRYDNVRTMINKGEFGDLIDGIITYYSGWKHNGVHVIDTLSYLFDDSIKITLLQKGAFSPYKDDPSIDGEICFSNKPGKLRILSFDESYYQLFEFDFRFEKARLRMEDFGSRIIFEEKVINNIGENILQLKENTFIKGGKSPIETAVELIVKFMETNNPDILSGYYLKDVKGTMETIWNGLELYEN